MSIDPELLSLLVCPKCRGNLIHAEAEQALDCLACLLRFAIEDNIPVLLVGEAQPLERPAPPRPTSS